MQSNKTQIRKKRLQYQQGLISFICLVMAGFVFFWLINTLVTGRKNGLLPTSAEAGDSTSSVTAADSEDSLPVDSSRTDSSSADSESGSDIDDSNDSADDSSSEADEPKPYDDAALTDDFSDACFIGDSRTVGLEMNCDKPNADFFASQGLNISTAMTELVVTLDDGTMGTVVDGVAQKQYNRIFIMFGINELGWPYPENFVTKYVELINAVKELQPDATIYIQSILPVSDKALESGDVFTNDNIDTFNGYVEQCAEQTGTTYLEINSYFKDETGKLPADASSDGIHFVRERCLEWIDILAYLTN